MKWPSPWGDGFPGWHIECSAMSLKHLGERFDVHTGGIDLKFPHHEDEIAQSEGALGHPVVSVWMHGEFLTMDDAKMAKSKGNIIRVADLPDLGYEPLAFRYLALTAHYRSKLDFTEDAMHAAASGLARLRRAAAGPDEPVDLRLSRWPATARASPRRSPTTWPRRGRWRSLTRSPRTPALTDAQRRALLLDFDRVLGLSLERPAEVGGAAARGGRRAARASRRRQGRSRLRRLRRASRRARRPWRRGARHAGQARKRRSAAERVVARSVSSHPGAGTEGRHRLPGGLRFDRYGDPPVADREHDSVCSIGCVELVRDRPQVIADRLIADAELLADLPVRPAAGDIREDLELTVGHGA